MSKKPTTIKPTRADIAQARDLQLRGECIGVAQGYSRAGSPGASVDDMLRAAQRIYDWMKGAEPPAEPAAQTTTV